MKNEIYENTQQIDKIRAILVGLNTDKSDDDFERSMNELKELTKAIDIDVAAVITQSLPAPDKGTYIGSGKVEEIGASLDVFDADIIIFNDSLSPMQVRNLEKALDTEVIDRTGLILQIFAKRARTREARLQVESAQLQYMLPRLVGMGTERLVHRYEKTNAQDAEIPGSVHSGDLPVQPGFRVFPVLLRRRLYGRRGEPVCPHRGRRPE